MEGQDDEDFASFNSLTCVPFVEYKVTLPQAKLGPCHPTRVMESSSLAAIKPPRVQYKLNRLLLKGYLSQPQLEAILLTANIHNKFTSGRRCGMLIGDGAGMGKGRTIAGIILENMCRGLKRSIWLSTNVDLFHDAKRDFNDIGIDENLLKSFSKVYNETDNALPDEDFCLFASYGSLAGKKRETRMKAIEKWLNPKDKFRGVIALDECHAVKNEDTRSHALLTQLDEDYPKARFVYCSATVAESPTHISYMHRLGLWGPGTEYPLGFIQLESVLKKTGYIGMEALALELKHNGQYISRRLDQGCAEFAVEEVALRPEEIDLYNRCTKFWLYILTNVREITHPKLMYKKLRFYWGAHQRFFRLLNLSFKLRWTVKYIRRKLNEGYAIVVGIQSTGYAKLSVNKKKTYAAIPSTLHLTIKDTVRRLLCGKPNRIKKIIRAARDLKLPPNFLDTFIHKLGSANVSELTGRKERLVRTKKLFSWRKIQYSRVKAQKMFMDGETNVAIVSDASSCGISLHASKDCTNQKQRIHLTLELPWSAEKIIQQCGRTLRSNQSSAPRYVLVVTDVAGEKRFGYGISAKMQALGAITQADRTLSVNSLETFSINSQEAEKAILYTLQSIALVISPVLKYPGQNIYEFFRKACNPLLSLGLLTCKESQPCLPRKPVTTAMFLNRLLGAKLPLQNEIYNYMMDIYQEVVQQSKSLGTFEQGVLDIGKRTSVLLSSKKFKCGETRVTLVKVKADQGVSFDEALEMKKKAEYANFYYIVSGAYRYIYMEIRFLNTGKYFRVYPCRVSQEETSPHNRGGFEEVTLKNARRIWQEVFGKGDQCFHRYTSCNSIDYRGHCEVSNRFQLRSMLLGIRWSNLSLISELMDGAKIPLQLVRCKLEKKTILGLFIPENKYDQVLQHLTEALLAG